MRTRKNALVAATVAALSFTVVAPAQAEQVTTYAAEAESSSESELANSSEGNVDGSGFFERDESKVGFERYSPAEKAAVIIFGGIAAATAGAFLYGVLRTLIYNIAGV